MGSWRSFHWEALPWIYILDTFIIIIIIMQIYIYIYMLINCMDTCKHALHCVSFRSVPFCHVTVHYIKSDYITLHALMHTRMHAYIHTYIHTITLHYFTLQYITLHYITLQYITLHYITLHYIHANMHAYIHANIQAWCMHTYILTYIAIILNYFAVYRFAIFFHASSLLTKWKQNIFCRV